LSLAYEHKLVAVFASSNVLSHTQHTHTHTSYHIHSLYIWICTPGFNFTNILHTAFTRPDPKSAKKTDNLTIYFALLLSAYIKSAHKMLTKLTPGKHCKYYSQMAVKSKEGKKWNLTIVWCKQKKNIEVPFFFYLKCIVQFPKCDESILINI